MRNEDAFLRSLETSFRPGPPDFRAANLDPVRPPPYSSARRRIGGDSPDFLHRVSAMHDIRLIRETPEALKPRRIEIGRPAAVTAPAIEAKVAETATA